MTSDSVTVTITVTTAPENPSGNTTTSTGAVTGSAGGGATSSVTTTTLVGIEPLPSAGAAPGSPAPLSGGSGLSPAQTGAVVGSLVGAFALAVAILSYLRFRQKLRRLRQD